MNEDTLNEEQFVKKGDECDEAKRPMVVLFQDVDGNWRGATRKGDKFINLRDVDPNTVLTRLITHA